MSTAEPLTPDVVDDGVPAPADLAIIEEDVPAAELAIPDDAPERAAQTITLFRTYVDLATRIAATEFVPKGLRGKPPAVLAAILTGHELGIGPMQSLAHIHVIDGKPTQSAELMRALITKAGHQFRIVKMTTTGATVRGRRREDADDPDAWLEVDYTLDDAAGAKLCQLKDGKAYARSSSGKVLPWEAHPRSMLLARATSELARAMFAAELGGVSYTPDELGAAVTVTPAGTIEVDVVDYAAGGSSSAGGAAPAGDVYARVGAMRPGEVVEELKARGLPLNGTVDEVRARLAEALAGEAPPSPPETAPQTPQEAAEAPPAPTTPAGGGAAPAGDVYARVGAMRPGEVVEELKARGLPLNGTVDEVRARLAEALAGEAPPSPPETAPQTPQEAAEAPPAPTTPAGGGAAPAGDVYARVGAMRPGEVVEELKARGLPLNGTVDEVRARLAEALAGEAPPSPPETAPQTPQEAAEAPPAPTTPAGPPEAQEDAQDPESGDDGDDPAPTPPPRFAADRCQGCGDEPTIRDANGLLWCADHAPFGPLPDDQEAQG